MRFSEDFDRCAAELDALLGTDRCCDAIARSLISGGRRCRVYAFAGCCDGAVLERVLAGLQAAPSAADAETMEAFLERCVSFAEAAAERDADAAVTEVLCGKTLLLAEGFDACALIDAKRLPARGVEEPASGRVLRGAHDGFVEALTVNTALLRRRIRDPRLTTEGRRLGTRSHTDVALCYLEHEADEALLRELREKLDAVDLRSLSMGQESVAEALMKPQWWNPFPSVRYTERPDVAAACILEGGVILLTDNSPAAMILPTGFFDFVQEANDFYFPPLIGSYLRLLRCTVFLLTLFITPVWYALVKTGSTQGALHFLAIAERYEVPLLLQLLFAEFIVDLIKLTSLNTPPVFSNSFSMIGALVLGDFAVQAHWLVPEVLAYMAFVAVANFAQPSYELGYAFKLLRLMLLLLVGALDWLGLALGTAVILALLATNRPIAGRGYLYPLVPFNARALRALLLRRPACRENT